MKTESESKSQGGRDSDGLRSPHAAHDYREQVGSGRTHKQLSSPEQIPPVLRPLTAPAQSKSEGGPLLIVGWRLAVHDGMTLCSADAVVPDTFPQHLRWRLRGRLLSVSTYLQVLVQGELSWSRHAHCRGGNDARLW